MLSKSPLLIPPTQPHLWSSPRWSRMHHHGLRSCQRHKHNHLANERCPSAIQKATDTANNVDQRINNNVTCLDEPEGSDRTSMEPRLKVLISRARTFLAMLVAIISPLETKVMSNFQRVTSRDRKLLQDLPSEIEANVVMAKTSYAFVCEEGHVWRECWGKDPFFLIEIWNVFTSYPSSSVCNVF